MTEKETKKDPKAGMAAPEPKAAAAAAPAPAPAVEGDDLFEEFELPGGPPKDAAELAADDADLPLWEEEWEDEDACDFAARLKRELAARVA